MNIINYTPRRMAPLTKEQRRRRQLLQGYLSGGAAIVLLVCIGIVLGRMMGV